ncbi:MAG: hypothetical protein EU532_05780 [Promethearchaeota archaeon]|nr:MAG: hypothetical protein EU532_05780 [Candidatus Lokiarchaeota archaeon]
MYNLSPREIFIAYQNKKLEPNSVIDYLNAFKEESDNDDQRVEAFHYLVKIDILELNFILTQKDKYSKRIIFYSFFTI